MVLLIDVGNTNMVLGIDKDNKSIAEWRLSTDYKKTSDEYGIQIMQLFAHNNLSVNEVRGVIISSVVPHLMYTLENVIRKYLEWRRWGENKQEKYENKVEVIDIF